LGAEGAEPQEVHVLVDLENNQPTLDEVRARVPDLTHVWLFHSGEQDKRLASFEPLGERRRVIGISRPGKNSLDFHLSFYLGEITALFPRAKLVIMAIDKGYVAVIEHAVQRGFAVVREPYLTGRGAEPPAKKSAKAAKKAAKKVPGKKAPAKKVAAKAVKREPAKKAAKASAKAAQTAAKKAPPKPAKKAATPATPAGAAPMVVPIDTKLLDRVAKSLKKMGEKAPKRRNALEKHIAPMLGQAPNAAATAVAELVLRGILRLSGQSVTYDFARVAG
jgi:hypothetical protein